MTRELWDAVDREGRPLGFDLVRGVPVPEGAYHLVVEIYAVTHDGRVLVTQRHPDKPWGLHWEVTGGSVVKGESPLAGARRELREETGIISHTLTELGRLVSRETRSLYVEFLCVTDGDKEAITLQEGETMGYRWVSGETLKHMGPHELVPRRMQPLVPELWR